MALAPRLLAGCLLGASARALSVVLTIAAGALVSETLASADPLDLPRFTNVSTEVGLGDQTAKRVTFADLDGDGYPELVFDARRAFRSRDQGSKFEAMPDAGLDRGLGGSTRKPDLVLFADVDGDGDLDALSGRYVEVERFRVMPETDERILDEEGCPIPVAPDPLERTEVLLNDGTGRFAVLAAAGLGLPLTTTALAAFDWDLDGVLDVYMGTWYREYGVSYRSFSDRLLRGLGDGRFVDVTERAGLKTEDTVGERRSAKPTYGVTHGDIDGDGRQDLLVATYGRQWNVLWRQRSDGTFEDVADAWGFDGDEARDGSYWVVERESEEPFRANGNTFDLALSDFDNDGDLDVFTGEIRHYWAGRSSDRSELLVNQGSRFERARDLGLERVHTDPWRWNEGDIHVGFLDFDNDGLDDVVVASGDYPDRQELRLWWQQPDHKFIEVTSQVGLDWEGCGGISIADYDRDGDLDIAVGRSLARLPAERVALLGSGPGLWRNDGGNSNHWLQVVLVGQAANRAAIGARVRVKVGGRTLTKELISSRGHMGHADELVLHFGLGRHRELESIEVRWPDVAGDVERFMTDRVDRRIELRQGKGQQR